MRSGLRSRLPDLLIEAAFVFFAVLVALGAEEWRENRQRDELADRALQNVLLEMGENRDAIERNQSENAEALERLRTALGELESGGRPDDLSINYQAALTSSAAWETARMSQAVHYLDFEVMSDLAGIYELQDFFERAQDDLMSEISSIGARMRDDERGTLEDLAGRVNAVLAYRDVLRQGIGALIEKHGPASSP